MIIPFQKSFPSESRLKSTPLLPNRNVCCFRGILAVRKYSTLNASNNDTPPALAKLNALPMEINERTLSNFSF